MLDRIDPAGADDNLRSPSRIRATRRATSAPAYWLSASVLTMMSALSFRQASRPAWNPAARPRLFGEPDDVVVAASARRRRAVGRPSSITSVSTTSIPSSRGRSAMRRGEGLLLVEPRDWIDDLHGRGSGYPSRPVRPAPTKHVRDRSRDRPFGTKLATSMKREEVRLSLIGWSDAWYSRGAEHQLAVGRRERANPGRSARSARPLVGAVIRAATAT